MDLDPIGCFADATAYWLAIIEMHSRMRKYTKQGVVGEDNVGLENQKRCIQSHWAALESVL